MFLSRPISSQRTLLTLALAAFAMIAFSNPALSAQASSSAQAEGQPPTEAPNVASNQGQVSVAARIKARREARRAAAIKEVYTHLYEAYVGTGYLRFHPGNDLQRLNEFPWNVGVTRYFNERLGVTVDARGTYGTAYTYPYNLNPSTAAFAKPSISQYAGMVGPTYRFVLNPKYSVSGRILGGVAYGNFTGDIGPTNPTTLGLYPDGISTALSASVPVEYNVSPEVGLRLAPEYLFTNFGSSTQNNLGFTASIVVRWGKQ